MGCITSKNTSLNESHRNDKYKVNTDEFKDLGWKDTKPFIVPLNDGHVIKVYDGDTITVANRLPLENCDDIFRFSVRLNGIANVTPDFLGTTL